MLLSLCALGAGAVCGAIMRWGLNLALNSLFPALPPGTLAANLLGGFLMGLATGFFTEMPDMAPQWRLFAITGFLGSLTTFSAFSGEMGNLLLQGRIGLCALGITLHTGGAIGMYVFGLWLFSEGKKIFQ